MPDQNLLNCVDAYNVDRNGLCRERLFVIPIADILYFFTCGALSKSRMVINSPWTQACVLRPGIVYARTAKGLFATRFRTLKKLASRLDHNNFHTIHQSVLVNLLKITDLDIGSRLKPVTVRVNGSTEQITVGRRYLKPLRPKLGLSGH